MELVQLDAGLCSMELLQLDVGLCSMELVRLIRLRTLLHGVSSVS
jgi:hypothetical protein